MPRTYSADPRGPRTMQGTAAKRGGIEKRRKQRRHKKENPGGAIQWITAMDAGSAIGSAHEGRASNH